MHVFREMGGKFVIAGELMAFLWRRKMWWMYPIVSLLLLFGIVIAVGSSTGAGPFIYAIF